jgi:hypothetical protein
MRNIIVKVIALIALLVVPAVIFAEDVAAPVTVKLYGYTKLDVIYATQRSYVGDLGFYLLPTVAGQTQSSLNITARESRFGLDLQGPANEQWKTSGKIELDFYTLAFGGGNENAVAPRIRLAYVDIANAGGFSFRAGQDWDAFVVVNPITVDAAFLGGYGHLYNRRPQVRVTQVIKLGDVKVTARLAAARTIGQITDASGIQDGGTDSGQPTVEGALFADAKLWTNKPARISISGHSGVETNFNSATNPNLQNYNTQSIIGGAVLPVTETVSLQGTYWQGADLRPFYGGIYQGINTTLKQSIEAKGGWAQVVANITPAINFNLGYGSDDPNDDNLNNGDRTLNTRTFTSLFYKANSAVTFAFEYSKLSTGYKNSTTANGEIYQGSAAYKF